MTFNAQKPRYCFKIADKDYELEGSFGLIEAVEYAMSDDIISIAKNCLEMPSSKVAKLIHAMVKHCGYSESKDSIFEKIVNEVGVSSHEFAILRFHLFAFLKICICKPSERQKVSADMGELIGKLESNQASLGENTSDSV